MSAPQIASREDRIFYGVMAAVFVVLSALSLLKAYTFHAGIYDLGIFHQVLFNTSRLHFFESSLKHMSYLGDHFSPSLLLLSPLEWLPFRIPALLIAQAACAAFVGWNLRELCLLKLNDRRLSTLIGIAGLLHPAILCPPFFDLHPEVFMAAALSRALLDLERGHLGISACFFAAVLLGKEDAGLLLGPLGLVLFSERARPARSRYFGLGLAAFSLVWVGLAVFVFMPHFRPQVASGGWFYLSRYGHLGSSPGEIVRFVLLHPLSAIARSFALSKLLTALCLVLGFAGAPLFSGRRLLAVLPIAGVHYLSSRWQQFHYWFQYLAPLVPVLGWATVVGAKKTFAARPRSSAAIALVIGLGAGLLTRLWLPWYVPEPQYHALRRAMSLVPDDASLCAQQTGAGPLLAARRHLDFCVPWEFEREQYNHFGWPETSNAEYQLFDLNDIKEAPAMPARLAALMAEGAEVLVEEKGVVLLRRRP